MSNKAQGIVAIVAALLVLFSAMLDATTSFIIATAALLGLGLWFYFSDPDKKSGRSSPLIKRQAEEKQKHKDAIMELFTFQSSVANNDVEKSLGVSDATATRYLEELVREGKLRQVGASGRGVRYEKL